MEKDLLRIVNNYGIQKQMFVWIEEMSELTKVICKWARKYDELDGELTPQLKADFLDEITDVTVSLDQIKLVINLLENDLNNKYKWKVNRQIKRVDEGK